MAAREMSRIRIALLGDETAGACKGAHRASIDVLLIGQTGANQGQLESSTESHSKCWLCRRAREKKCPLLAIYV
jgi:hypothetical protein